MIKFTMAICICVFCAGNISTAWAETEVVVTTTPAERIEAAKVAAGEEAAYRAAIREAETVQAQAWMERVKGRSVVRNYVTTPLRVGASAALTTDGIVIAIPGLLLSDLGMIILPGEVEVQRSEDYSSRDAVDEKYSRGAYAPAKVVVEGAK